MQGQKTLQEFRASYPELSGRLENEVFPESIDQPLNDIYRSYVMRTFNFLNLHAGKLLTKQTDGEETVDTIGSRYVDSKGRTLRLVAVNNINNPLQIPQVSLEVGREAKINAYVGASERASLLDGGKDRHGRTLIDIKKISKELYERLSGIVSREAISRGDFILQDIDDVSNLRPQEILYGRLVDGSTFVGVTITQYDPVNDQDEIWVAYKRAGEEENPPGNSPEGGPVLPQEPTGVRRGGGSPELSR